MGKNKAAGPMQPAVNCHPAGGMVRKYLRV